MHIRDLYKKLSGGWCMGAEVQGDLLVGGDDLVGSR